MTIDEIAQKIYEERYAEPKHPEIAMYLRDGMVREVVQRTLELATGNLATDLVVARRARCVTRAGVTAWMEEAGSRGELVIAEQAPGWNAYERAEAAWHDVITRLDAWIARKEQP